MKSRRDFKKKNAHYLNDQEELKIKERKRLPKKQKINKRNFYAFLDEEEDNHFNLFEYEEE